MAYPFGSPLYAPQSLTLPSFKSCFTIPTKGLHATPRSFRSAGALLESISHKTKYFPIFNLFLLVLFVTGLKRPYISLSEQASPPCKQTGHCQSLLAVPIALH